MVCIEYGTNGTVDSIAPSLFDRLPQELFRPLAAANNRRYWELLCKLLAESWGDGARSPGEEIPRNDVVRVIESFLVMDDPWEDESGETLITPVGIRAVGVYNTFRDSGWLTQRRRGIRDTVTIRPVIAQFFTLLSDFATQEPEFLGSKFFSIQSLLRSVASGEIGADAYAEAARQSKQCMAHIANTGCHIHDLMDSLVATGTAREFVKGFFEDYIEKVFIADYSEIRTKDHPLQYRAAIISTTIQFQHDNDKRESLIKWYQDKQANGDRLKAEILYERDTRQLLRLKDVEQHLRRLDDEIRSANQRAMAFIEYKLRAPRNFDKLIARAILGAGIVHEGHIALPAASGSDLAAEHWLAKPRLTAKELTPTRIDRREPTIEELAWQSLRKRMMDSRMVRPDKLAAYVARHLNGGPSIYSEQLEIESIADLCCYQRLLLIASRNEAPRSITRHDPFVQMLPTLRIQFVEGVETRNEYMQHRRFGIHKEKVT